MFGDTLLLGDVHRLWLCLTVVLLVKPPYRPGQMDAATNARVDCALAIVMSKLHPGSSTV